MAFGEFIKGTRLSRLNAKGRTMTHLDVALAIGCSASRVSSWESGAPVLEKWLVPLSGALDVPLAVLTREWEKTFRRDPVPQSSAVRQASRLMQLEALLAEMPTREDMLRLQAIIEEVLRRQEVQDREFNQLRGLFAHFGTGGGAARVEPPTVTVEDPQAADPAEPRTRRPRGS